MSHISVLLHEAVEGLNIKPESIIVDGTLGAGGHTEYICETYGPSIKIIALDRDENALNRSKDRLASYQSQIIFECANFRDLDQVLEKHGIHFVEGIILDLGLSSYQIEEEERGFSFLRDEPLLMTMKKNPAPEDVTAHDVVNTWSEESLADIIYGYGEERYSRRIAHGIVEARKQHPINTTFKLVEVIRKSVPGLYQHQKTHCATKTFQAIRIAVNDELGSLREALSKGILLLSPAGRFSIISFHSLEDRIVKHFFRQCEKDGKGRVITKRPLTPTEKELEKNSRARSAKLRIFEKV